MLGSCVASWDLLGTACLALCLQSATHIIQMIPAFLASFPMLLLLSLQVTIKAKIIFFPEIRWAEGSDHHGGKKHTHNS